MSMTKKIRPVDANNLARRIREYMADFPNATTRLATCRAILSMLGDEKQTPTLRSVTREQAEKVWRGCEKCNGAGEYSRYAENLTKILLAKYCPHCGRPLTDKAVEMVMERLEALKDGKDD